MSDADLEAYISKKKHIIKTKSEIVGICFGILIGSWFVIGFAMICVEIVSIYFDISNINYLRIFYNIIWFLFSIGTLVGIAFLPYRTRENIINDFKGISYLSTAQIFAIVIGSSPLFFLMVNTLYQHAIQL